MFFRRGFTMPGALIGIVALLVISGGAYYFVHHAPARTSMDQPTNTNQPNKAPSGTPFAALDTEALHTDSLNPTITGTCGNVSGALAIYIHREIFPFPKTGVYAYDAVYQTATDHGGQLDSSCESSHGTFSTHFENPTLQPGVYTVGIYTYTNLYTNDGYQGPEHAQLLTTGTLTIGEKIISVDALPTNVWECDRTTVTWVGARLMNATTGKEDPNSGSSIGYADGGRQVSYDIVPSMLMSKAGDEVNLCLISKPGPSECPPGDDRGWFYKTTNLRTKETWQEYNSQHMCGGA